MGFFPLFPPTSTLGWTDSDAFLRGGGGEPWVVSGLWGGKSSLKKRKARLFCWKYVCHCVFLCTCASVWTFEDYCYVVSELFLRLWLFRKKCGLLSLSMNSLYTIIQRLTLASHRMHLVHNVPVLESILSWHLHILQHATSISVVFFLKCLYCFAEKNREECCPFVSKKRLKKQWALAFVSAVTDGKAQSHAVPYGSAHSLAQSSAAGVWIHFTH